MRKMSTKTVIPMAINIGISNADRKKIAHGLSKFLADSYTLYLICLLYTSPSPRDS